MAPDWWVRPWARARRPPYLSVAFEITRRRLGGGAEARFRGPRGSKIAFGGKNRAGARRRSANSTGVSRGPVCFRNHGSPLDIGRERQFLSLDFWCISAMNDLGFGDGHLAEIDATTKKIVVNLYINLTAYVGACFPQTQL